MVDKKRKEEIKHIIFEHGVAQKDLFISEELVERMLDNLFLYLELYLTDKENND